MTEKLSSEARAILTSSVFMATLTERSRISVFLKIISLTDYILREKTEEAKKLLRHTDKPILAVSEYLGFSSQSHFTRVFKKITGLTPGKYRQEHK